MSIDEEGRKVFINDYSGKGESWFCGRISILMGEDGDQWCSSIQSDGCGSGDRFISSGLYHSRKFFYPISTTECEGGDESSTSISGQSEGVATYFVICVTIH